MYLNFKFRVGLFIAAICFVSTNVSGDIVVNFNDDIQGPVATVADFQEADAALDADAALFAINNDGVGADAEIGYVDFQADGSQQPATGSDGLSFALVGTPQNDGFAIGAGANNFQQSIFGSNLFDTMGDQLGVDITGLSDLPVGSTVVVTAYGIGDNIGQQVGFNASFGSDMQTGFTAYNQFAFGDEAADRLDATGQVPYVQFTFVTDGTTDLLSLSNFADDTVPGIDLALRTHFSGFSVSVTDSGDSACPLGELADINRDGIVNFLDIAPFILLLSNGDFQCEGDVNQDGAVDFLDISPFITVLSSQ